MNENELRELCVSVVKIGRTTQEQKNVIAEECERRNIPLNRRCANCYVDAAAIIYAQLPKSDPESDGRQWVLRPGVDVLFGGIRICDTTLTDALAETIAARGFDVKFFAKMPQ